MLPVIDARTLFVASAVVFAGLAISVALAWRELKSLSGPDRFVKSYALFLVGLVLFALQGQVSPVLSLLAGERPRRGRGRPGPGGDEAHPRPPPGAPDHRGDRVGRDGRVRLLHPRPVRHRRADHPVERLRGRPAGGRRLDELASASPYGPPDAGESHRDRTRGLRPPLLGPGGGHRHGARGRRTARREPLDGGPAAPVHALRRRLDDDAPGEHEPPADDASSSRRTTSSRTS